MHKLVLLIILSITAGLIHTGYLTRPMPQAIEEVPVVLPPGTSPDYLMGKGGEDVMVFRCVPGNAKLQGFNYMTDGTNWLHIYQKPCWAI